MASLPAFHSFNRTAAGAQDNGSLHTSQVKEANNAQSSPEQAQLQSNGKSEAEDLGLFPSQTINSGPNKALTIVVDEKVGYGDLQVLPAHAPHAQPHRGIPISNPSGENGAISETPRDSNLDTKSSQTQVYNNEAAFNTEASNSLNTSIQPPQSSLSSQLEVSNTKVDLAVEVNNSLNPISVQSAEPHLSSQTGAKNTNSDTIEAEVNTSLDPTSVNPPQPSRSSETGVNTPTNGIRDVHDDLKSTAVPTPQLIDGARDVFSSLRVPGSSGPAFDDLLTLAVHEGLDCDDPLHPISPEILRALVHEIQQLKATGRLGPEPYAATLEAFSIKVNFNEYVDTIMMRIAQIGRRALWLVSLVLSIVLFKGNITVAKATSAVMWSTVLILPIALFFAVSVVDLIKNRKSKFNNTALMDRSKLRTAYYFYVLGSGGHTTEMLALIKLSHVPNKNVHRRYLVAADDTYSETQSVVIDQQIRMKCAKGKGGTSDTATATRARSVGQSFSSSFRTSLLCAWEIIAALVTIPKSRALDPRAELYRYPDVIVTNGPGTGFIVALVAFVLKVLYLVPRDRLKIVFMETWARNNKLGLTGKLFYWTNIADVFVVQSEDLAKAYNVPCIGNVNQQWADYNQRDTKEEAAASEKGAGE